jgi:DNA-binding transcriptional ArsR family regulator
VASLYLRALNARGLLAARRLGRHVFYHAEADASMTAASALLDAIRKEAAGHSDPVQPLYRAATAFTHPRRTLIVRALAAGPADFAALRADTGISRDALGRHLRKLLVRRVVVLRDGAYRCATPRTPIARALLQLAQSG